MPVNIGPRIGIDGEAEYRKQIQNIIQSTKTLKSEMQALETQATKSKNPFVQLGNEMTKNAEKRKLLSSAIDEQKAKLADLNTMASASEQKYGEMDTKTQKWKQAVADAQTELNKLNAEMDNTPTKMESIGNAMQSAGDKIAGVGSTLTTHVTAPLVGLGALSLKEFGDWESAFTGVMKTVDETATTSYADIEEAIKKMATETASSKEEIAGVAEVAGQLGVGADDIEKFTKTMVMLGDSTNLSSDQAATSLARILNITGESTDNIDRLGASVVALGNNFATDEASIVEMSNRLAAAGTIAGLSTQDILGIATAMSSVGIQAEAGGTAMTQTLTGISKAVSEGGEKLEQLASASGMSAEEFSNAWNTSPVEALQAFIGGLSQMNEAELDTYKVLDELGMSGIRQSNMLQSLALASDTLTSAVETSNAAYEQNTALVDEASKRYETFDAKMSQTKEKLSNVGVELGERLLPYVDKVLDGVDGLVQAWDNLSPGAQDAVVKIGLIAAAIGPLLVGLGKLSSAAGAIVTNAPIILGALSSVGGFITGTLGPIITSGISLITGTIIPAITGTVIPALASVGTFLTGTLAPAVGSFIAAAAPIIAPFLPFIAIAAAVVGAGVLIYQNWDTIKEKASELKENVSAKWEEFKEDTTAKFEEMRNNAHEKWENLRTGVEAKAETMKTNVESKVESLKNSAISKWETLRGEAQSKWETIKNQVTEKAEIMRSDLDTKVTRISDAFNREGGGWKGILAGGLEAARIGMETEFGLLDTLTGGKLSEIGKHFTDLKDNALTWGKDMVANFISGIQQKWDELKDSATATANLIKKQLHFSVPDEGPLKDADTYMPDFMKLLASGINDNLWRVEAAASNVAAAVGQDISQPTYSSSVGAVNIVINAHEGQSVEDLADIVQERINREVMLSARSMA